MNETLTNLMREATRLTQSGNLMEATAAIQRALGNTKVAAGPMPASSASNKPTNSTALSAPSPIILDDCVFEVPQPACGPSDAQPPEPVTGRQTLSEFSDGSHTHASLTRRYKLYKPADSSGKNLPLVVMLHGCTQNPTDFAAGTRMNELADEQNFFVLYPEQAADANPQRCWNWFKHTHQSRGHGEAALLASMTLAVTAQHGIDPRRVYIAGLSAGGAMAAIVAAAYPEIFAAVGVHSGLAVGAASNVAQALAAMQSGGNAVKLGDRLASSIAVPSIVFHGDHDKTVHPVNGEQVIGQFSAGSIQHVEKGMSRGGRHYTRTVYQPVSEANNTRTSAEHWLMHGAGHAWSGGNSGGTYTDSSGPDASREMLRFFLEHPKHVAP